MRREEEVMKRMLWMIALGLGVSVVFIGIADALAGLASQSAAVSQQVAGIGVTVIATLL